MTPQFADFCFSFKRGHAVIPNLDRRHWIARYNVILGIKNSDGQGFGSFKPQSVALMVGPEGGFSAEDVEQAQAEGVLPVSLGPRILRTETAAMVAAALVQSYLGDLG